MTNKVQLRFFSDQTHHRMLVSTTCMFYKVRKLNHTHINSLRMDGAHSITHEFRGVLQSKDQLHVLFAKTEQFLRSFQPMYVRLRNQMVCSTITRAPHFKTLRCRLIIGGILKIEITQQLLIYCICKLMYV